jgi:alginate production protein
MTILRARRYGLTAAVALGKGECLPFADSSFDLVICKDMLEHCQSPPSVLAEIRRILSPGGVAYMTVVNRFPFRDPHYHLWFINFLPARLADRYVDWRGRGKHSFGDRQRLHDMHYYTLPSFRQLASRQGLRIRRDLHGLGRQTEAESLGRRLRRAAGHLAYRIGNTLSIGVTSFELLIERGGPLMILLVLLAAMVTGGPVRAADFGLTSLRPGIRLEVRVKQRGDRFSASRVTLKPDDGRDIEIKAPIDAAGGTSQTERSIHLLGRPITLDEVTGDGAATSISEVLEKAGPGSWVEVRGRDRGDWIVAESISIRDQPSGHAEIEGPIEKVKPRGNQVLVEIGGFEIEVDEDARFIADGHVVASARQRPGFMDDDDARPQSIRLFDGRLAVGGQLRADIDPESDFDLDTAASDDMTVGAMTAQVEMDAQIAPRLVGFTKLSLIRQLGLREPEGVDLDEGDLRLEEMYLGWEPPFPGLAIQFGRQDFDEPREWLYDENLDALRFYVTPLRRVALELSIAGQLGEEGAAGHYGYAMAVGRLALESKAWASAYAIGRNDPTAGSDGRWYGLRAAGAPRRGIDPWLELAFLRGSTGAGRTYRANAIDAGGTIEPLALLGYSSRELSLRPAFTVGYARGSGDETSEDTIDGTFRQTGFEDNTGRFSGVTSFNYYGELLDVELANLAIWTMGTGFHLARNTSVDLIYHRYEQVVADDRLRADLDVDPTGDNPFIGSAVDLIIGMEEIENLEIEVDLAAFMPGRAFAPPADTATRASFQFKWNF